MYKNKWEAWYDNQPEHIKRYLDQPRAIWHDSDMWKAFGIGIAVGFLIGVML